MLVAGESALAEAQLRKQIHRGMQPDVLIAEIARVMILRGELAGAVAELKQHCESDEPLSESRRMLGWLLLNDGDARAAAVQFDRVVQDGARDPRTLELLAAAWTIDGEPEQALKALVRLASLGGEAAARAEAQGVRVLGLMGIANPGQEWRSRLESAALARPGPVPRH